ncbi:hypothetical protein Y032_0204g1886 [Ancylostoma ceylanicum]|nr:hypothetical protein Y032_0204g1886 [Ancylostoma ceylanicum]
MHAALSPTRPISAEEQQAIVDLRTILPSIECLEDSYILRWLRAKDLRFDETAEALKKHVTFRKAWELDTIDSWVAPECLEKYCGYGFLSDKEGRPILMSLLGNMDVEADLFPLLFDQTRAKDLVALISQRCDLKTIKRHDIIATTFVDVKSFHLDEVM